MPDLLQDVAVLLPPAMHYPDIVAARVRFGGVRFETASFADAVARMDADILVDGQCQGEVSVAYIEQYPLYPRNPFLPEERELLKTVAERLGNILARRVAEERLRLAKEFTDELIEAANVMVLGLNRHGMVTLFNAMGEKITGYSRDELLGRNWFEIILPNEKDSSTLKAFEKHMATGVAGVELENTIWTRSGETRQIAWWNSAFRDSQGELFAISFGIDVTDQRRAEEALRLAHDQLEQRVQERTSELGSANRALQQESSERLRAIQEVEKLNSTLNERAAELADANQRLKEMDRLKSEFLATMSHELRTPLNSIIGFTGILLKGIAGPLNPEQEKQLTMILGSARHLLSLINDLLDLSRIESGDVRLEIGTFSLDHVIEEVIQNLQLAAAQKNLALSADLRDKQIEMSGDRRRCYQVLLNLASNAVKFTERGSVTLSASLQGECVHICVADTGIGIRPEQMGALFQAFRQIDGSSTRVYEGTGLGLHLCKELLDLMGGTVSVESKFGAGSRFTVILPLQQQPRE